MKEVKRIALKKITCGNCETNLFVRPTIKRCPVCGKPLKKPRKTSRKKRSQSY